MSTLILRHVDANSAVCPTCSDSYIESLLRDILKKKIQQFYHNESWSFGDHAQYAQLACVKVIIGTQPGYAYVFPEVAGWPLLNIGGSATASGALINA